VTGRYALLADVHANLEALEAVLAHVDRTWTGAQLLCAGDLVGYGADPEAVIARLRERGVLAIAGNHEGMVLGRLGFERCIGAGIRAALWTRRTLSAPTRAWLEQLPARLELAEDGLLVCHGDLDDVQHYVRSERAARELLAAAARRFPAARLVVAGHTHAPLLCEEEGPCGPAAPGEAKRAGGGRALVNPGSVGQSRDGVPEARYAQYDARTGALRFCSLAYDHAAAEAKMQRAGLARTAVLDLGRRPPAEMLRDRCTRLLARSPLGCALLSRYL
jgi:diadenosine tetraphosphatase ApaH/serine/threonine PP2A family protein phosphatase